MSLSIRFVRSRQDEARQRFVTGRGLGRACAILFYDCHSEPLTSGAKRRRERARNLLFALGTKSRFLDCAAGSLANQRAPSE